MSDQPRALPDRPSLRFLKLEAKRRLNAGEFASLHEAQLAVAREHGFSSWSTLKTAVQVGGPSSALAHVRWVIEAFRDAGDPAWEAPDDEELHEHFDARYLALVPSDTLVSTLRRVSPRLHGELVVSRATAGTLRAQLADLWLEA